MTDWLSDIKLTAAGKSLTKLRASHSGLARLLGGIAEASPYLWDLIRDDPVRLARLLTSNPDNEFAALLCAASNAVKRLRARPLR